MASFSFRATLLRTDSSAHATFRFLFWAIAFIKATASLVTLVFMVESDAPCKDTGWEAPIFVPGAMAAICDARVIKTPAEPACAPAGEIYTTTGTEEVSMLLTMVLVEVNNPPGVFRCNKTQVAFSVSALSIALLMYSADAGFMLPSTVTAV